MWLTRVFKEPCIRWASRSPTWRGNYGGCLAHWRTLGLQCRKNHSVLNNGMTAQRLQLTAVLPLVGVINPSLWCGLLSNFCNRMFSNWHSFLVLIPQENLRDNWRRRFFTGQMHGVPIMSMQWSIDSAHYNDGKSPLVSYFLDPLADSWWNRWRTLCDSCVTPVPVL